MQRINPSFFLFFFLGLFALHAACVSAQQSPSSEERLLSPAAFQEDLAILQKHLYQIHGAPFTYHDRTTFDTWFERQQSGANAPLSVLDAYRIIGQLHPLIGDSHTEIRLPERYYDAIDQEYRLFPFGVRYLRDSLFVTVNLSENEDVVLGSVILRINGQDAGAQFRQIRAYFERDGFNETGPNAQASSLFMDYHALLIEQPDAYTLDLMNPEGKPYSITVPAEQWPVLEKRLKAHWEALLPPATPKPPLAFRTEDGVGYLRIRSFSPQRLAQAKQKPERFFAEMVGKLNTEGVKELIIDVRGNGGGSETVFMPLLRHLLATPFRVYRELSVRTLEIPDHQYYPYDKPKKLERLAQKTYTLQGERYVDTKDPATNTTAPVSPHFAGTVFVLMDERAYSATGDFLGVLQAQQRATFVGEETGGNPYQNVAGERLTLVLPNSKIRLGIPLLKYVINNDHPNTGHGMMPDIPLPRPLEDIIYFKDDQLQQLFQLIRTER